MLKRVTTVFATLLIAAGISLVVASPAHAAYIDCPNGQVCLFRDRNGGGGILVNVVQQPGTCFNLPSLTNDRATSYVNRMASHRYMQVYRDANCTGHALHKDNGFGGGTQPFPPLTASYPTYLNASGNFINVDNVVLPGCGYPDHCDNDIATSIWFNSIG